MSDRSSYFILNKYSGCLLYLEPQGISLGAGTRNSGWQWLSLLLLKTDLIHRLLRFPSEIQTLGSVSPVDGRVKKMTELNKVKLKKKKKAATVYQSSMITSNRLYFLHGRVVDF